MNQKVLLTWALTASLVAVGAIGFSLGKHAGNSDADHRAAVSPTERPVTTEPGAAVDPVPEYVVPESLARIPSEWRSPDTADLEGFSVLFNPVSRQAIVESCRHTGYRLDDTGRPLEMFGEFCTSILHGRLDSLTDSKAVVNTKDGRTVSLKLEPDMTREPATLRLEFEGHEMMLIAGSRNDLLQAMELEPELQKRKQRYFAAADSRGRGTSGDNEGAGRTD